MNVYLFLIYFLFSLIYSYIYATISFVMLMLYAIIQSYVLLSLSVSLIKPYLFIIFPLPFHSLSWGLIRCTILIVPSHFSSFFCFYSIPLSSLSHHHPTLPDPKSCAGLSPYSHYLCSAQPQPSSISRRPVYTISLSFNLV